MHQSSSGEAACSSDSAEKSNNLAEGYILKEVVTADGQLKTYKLVVFSENDGENPQKWSKFRKWWATMIVSFMCFAVAFASAVITPSIYGVAAALHTTTEVSLLAITLFVFGFGIGRTSSLEPLTMTSVNLFPALVASPLSELYGRKRVYLISFGIAVVFIIPCAVAKNIQTLLVCRAIDGIAFSTPIALVGGTLADMWHRDERAVPMAVFSAAPFLGPIIGKR